MTLTHGALGAPPARTRRGGTRSANLTHRPLEGPLRRWTVLDGPGSAYLRLLAASAKQETAPVGPGTVSPRRPGQEVSDGCSI